MSIQNCEDEHLIGLYAKRDIAISHGEGSNVFDTEGKKYLDLTSQYGAASLGYNHPRFTEIMAPELSKLQSCHNSFYNAKRAELAEKLVEIVNDECSSEKPLARVFLSSTGTEAVEAALKFARVATGKTEVLSCRRGYHGRTMGALSATATAKYQKPFEPLVPGFSAVSFNKIEDLGEAITDQTGAIILEPIQGEGGIRPADKAYLERVRVLCEERNILLIFDEIQTGVGRTGKWCAFHYYGVSPDILCLSKALGNGIPVAATIVTEEVNGKIPPGSHGTTFGGNPFSSAAALATIEIIEQENLLTHIEKVGAFTMNQFRDLNHPKIRDVRGMGLMIGIELKEKVGKYLKVLQEKGFLIFPAGSTVIRILPPYIISEEEISAFIDVFISLLDQN